MKKKRVVSGSTKNIIFICILLLGITIGIAIFLNISLKKRIKEMVYNSMNNVSETAAAFINGDTFKTIGKYTSSYSDEYKEIKDVLDKFKENNDFVYIYTVKQDDNGKYIFVIDQDNEKTASYGEPIVYTDAMAQALRDGVTTIDREKTTDTWGSYYSAFSPIRDSEGKVVGAVGVDFDSIWYEDQISEHSTYFIILFVLAMAAGVGISLLLMSQVVKKFRTLNRGLSSLSKDIDSLTDEINAKSPGETVKKEDKYRYSGETDIEEINLKMISMEKELKKYIEYVHNQAFTDTMTGASSKIAYYEYLKELQKKIDSNKANFMVIVFDLNGLKKINDNFGHECGDDFITNSASVIVKLFGKENTFRIGGDEFIVILEDKDYTVEEINEMVLREVDEFNMHMPKEDVPVSFSFGASSYRAGVNDTFKKVFKRADEIMYQYKGAFYKKFGDRRKN
ncbi:MAG: diguanylate cyclase [Bacilli bacterium]|nr:diguanylate cyclase [Bacilli bacterium]